MKRTTTVIISGASSFAIAVAQVQGSPTYIEYGEPDSVSGKRVKMKTKRVGKTDKAGRSPMLWDISAKWEFKVPIEIKVVGVHSITASSSESDPERTD